MRSVNLYVEHRVEGAALVAGARFVSPADAIKAFPRNRFGYFDMPG